MSRRRITYCAAAAMLCMMGTAAVADGLTPIEQLGKQLFFDTNLSTPPGQSCAACHAPEVGFTGPISELNAHGAVYPIFNTSKLYLFYCA